MKTLVESLFDDNIKKAVSLDYEDAAEFIFDYVNHSDYAPFQNDKKWLPRYHATSWGSRDFTVSFGGWVNYSNTDKSDHKMHTLDRVFDFNISFTFCKTDDDTAKISYIFLSYCASNSNEDNFTSISPEKLFKSKILDTENIGWVARHMEAIANKMMRYAESDEFLSMVKSKKLDRPMSMLGDLFYKIQKKREREVAENKKYCLRRLMKYIGL